VSGCFRHVHSERACARGGGGCGVFWHP
jgi:hypothetical protein